MTDLALLLAVVIVIAVAWQGLPDKGASTEFAHRAHQALARQLGQHPDAPSRESRARR